MLYASMARVNYIQTDKYSLPDGVIKTVQRIWLFSLLLLVSAALGVCVTHFRGCGYKGRSSSVVRVGLLVTLERKRT